VAVSVKDSSLAEFRTNDPKLLQGDLQRQHHAVQARFRQIEAERAFRPPPTEREGEYRAKFGEHVFVRNGAVAGSVLLPAITNQDEGLFVEVGSADRRYAVTVRAETNQLVDGYAAVTLSRRPGFTLFRVVRGAWRSHALDPDRIFDVRDFGAIGDGTTDDTDAILLGIDVAGEVGGALRFSWGTYLVSEELVISADKLTILGAGGIVKKGAEDFNIFRVSGTFNKILGLEIDGDDQPEGSLILVTGADNEVADCYLHDNGDNTDGTAYSNQSHGIAFDGQATTCRRNFVHHCRVMANHDIGISQNLAPDNILDHNTVSSNGLEAITIDNQAHRCTVVGNMMRDNCLLGGAAAISLDRADLCRITANGIYGVQSGADGIKTNNNLGSSSYGVIDGNHIIDANTGGGGWGIRLFAGALGTADRWTVTGNVCRGNTLGPIRMDAGCDNNKITGNDINGGAVSNAGAGNTLTANT
jgi:hypothetical protein